VTCSVTSVATATVIWLGILESELHLEVPVLLPDLSKRVSKVALKRGYGVASNSTMPLSTLQNLAVDTAS
jgi:hypothetical protein